MIDQANADLLKACQTIAMGRDCLRAATITLDSGATVTLCEREHDGFRLNFVRDDGLQTTVYLSKEAMAALVQLYLELPRFPFREIK